MYDMNDITINTFNKGVDVEQWMDDVVGWMTLLFEHTNYSVKHTGVTPLSEGKMVMNE
jgi:hypothetical protein